MAGITPTRQRRWHGSLNDCWQHCLFHYQMSPFSPFRLSQLELLPYIRLLLVRVSV